MGVDDMMISFALSYIAGNIPLIKDWLERNQGLQEEIDKCYDRALKKWSVNSGIREIEQFRKPLHFEELKDVLSGKNIEDTGSVELVKLWIEELRKNDTCYSFILEHKSDLLSIKLDEGFVQVVQALNDNRQALRDILEKNREDHDQVMTLLNEIRANQANIPENELCGKILHIVEGVSNKLIENLKLTTAQEILEEIEKAFGDPIKKNKKLESTFLKAKGRSLSFSNPKEAIDLFHQAFLLTPDDEKLIETEVIRLRKSHLAEALALSKQLLADNDKRYVLEVCYSDNPEQTYNALPDAIKSDYSLRYSILTILGEQNKETAFLFSEETIKEDSCLTYHNMTSWMYVMTWHNVHFGGELRLSKLQPVSQYTKPAFETSSKLMSLLDRTEVKPFFAMAEAFHCYWGHILDGNQKWIDEIHGISRKDEEDQAVNLNMLEVSMLVTEQRFDEAFQIIASMREHITLSIADYVIMMGYHANDLNMIGWVMDIVKEKSFKLNSIAAVHIAYCISPETASGIQRLIDDNLFENCQDAIVLRELCNLYDGRTVNIEILKQSLDGLTDDMTAYAAQVLANSGEAKMAFELLKPKVGDGKMNMRQRIFIDIMALLPEEHPHLYKLLIEHRESGEPCDSGLLSLEYMLDTRVGDYKNAYEAVSILYDRMPHDENVLVNYVRMTGRFNPDKLEYLKQDVMRFQFKDFASVKQVYQIYAENKMPDVAVELLYRYVNDTTDVDARAFYYMEATMGVINSLVYKSYKVATEGLYVICDSDTGGREFFKVDLDTELGEKLMGMCEGQRFEVIVDGEERNFVISHITNKYGKLSAEVVMEAARGDNPHFKPIQLSPDRLLESLQEELVRINPEALNYQKNKLKAEDDYERGEGGIINFVKDDDIIGGYYNRLFSPSKVFVAPWQLLEGLTMQGGIMKGMRFVLDITGLLLLFEYHQKTGFKFKEKFLIASTTYEFVVTTCKNSARLASYSYGEALRGEAIVKHKNYIDIDLEIRMNRLRKWIDENCEVEVPDKSLSFDGQEKKSVTQMLLMNTLSLLLTPYRCLITDDQMIEKMLRLKVRVITTETYMRLINEDNDADRYVEFLSDCNYIGVFLGKDFIMEEYRKMETGQPNKMTYITRNAGYNEIQGLSVIQACISIASEAKDQRLARMTITNLLAMMINAIEPSRRSVMVARLMATLPIEYKNTQIVRQCLQDAARMKKVILLPPGYGSNC